MRRLSRVAWAAGWPLRGALLVLIGAYRVTLGQVVGGSCRFYPSCSAYAAQAIKNVGAIRGTLLAVWRVLRCSPLSRGGVDRPPSPRRGEPVDEWTEYDADIRTKVLTSGGPG